MQEHYPERLGKAVAINVPFLVHTFFKLVLPFVDPITRAKLAFNPNLVKEGFFTSDMLMANNWGGDHDFEYVHEKYWPALLEASSKNVEKWKKTWKELGGKVGISEWDYKQGDAAQEEDEKADDQKDDAAVDVVPTEESAPKAVPAPAPVVVAAAIEPPVESKAEDTKKNEPEDKKHDTGTNANPAGQATNVGAVAAGATAVGAGGAAASAAAEGGASSGGGDAGADGGAE